MIRWTLCSTKLRLTRRSKCTGVISAPAWCQEVTDIKKAIQRPLIRLYTNHPPSPRSGLKEHTHRMVRIPPVVLIHKWTLLQLKRYGRMGIRLGSRHVGLTSMISSSAIRRTCTEKFRQVVKLECPGEHREPSFLIEKWKAIESALNSIVVQLYTTRHSWCRIRIRAKCM